MYEVFTLAMYNHDSHTEDFVYSSQNIFDIIDKIFSRKEYSEISDIRIYITDCDRNSIPYTEWRGEKFNGK